MISRFKVAIVSELDMRLKEDLSFCLDYFGLNINSSKEDVEEIAKEANRYGHKVTTSQLMDLIIEERR
jgi:hypothetical protein